MPAFQRPKTYYKVDMDSTPCIQSVQLIDKKETSLIYIDKNGIKRKRKQVLSKDNFMCESFQEAKEKASNRIRSKIFHAKMNLAIWEVKQTRFNRLQESDLT